MKKIIFYLLLIIILLLNTSSYKISKKSLYNYIDSLSIRQKIGQLFFVYAPQDFNFITEPGGMIPSKKILKQLLLGENQKKLKSFEIPPFLGIDQEGGNVNRFYFITDFPSMYELSHMNIKLQQTFLDSQIALMKKCNINVNFSPVIDYSILNGSNMNIMQRNISRNPDSISIFGKFYIDYFKKNRILCTIKHYPGYGNTYYNSDAALYKYKGYLTHFFIEYSIFSSLIPHSDFVMVSNLIYPFLDSIPALLSKTIMKSIYIQNDLSIILTDDIACRAHKNPYKILLGSIQAGGDMFILMDHTLYEPMIDSTLYWIKTGVIDEERLNRTMKKIILKKEYLFRIISDYSY